MVRFLLLLGVTCVASVAPTALFIVCALAYALRYTAYELIVIAAAIDAYYGMGTSVPYYTICTILGVLIIEWMKPRISLYNEVS